MRLIAALVALASTISPADMWWLDSYGFSSIPQTGKGVTVAVIDTGIDDTHPDLSGTVVGGRDFSGLGAPDGTAPVGPASYHGTMVASLIAGQGSDVAGVRGVAPGAKLLSLSVGAGVEGADTDTQISQAVIWAVNQGADVINISLSRDSRTWPKSWDRAFSYAFENDVVIVAASGNKVGEASKPSAPATMPGVVAVGGLSKAGAGAQQATTTGISLAVTAPAEELWGSYPGGTVREWSGSSAAAPLVTGLLALMIEADPQASANDLIQRLLGTADDLGQPGFDAIYGFGAINPEDAVASTLTSEQNPLGSLSEWVKLYRPGSLEEQGELLTPEQPVEISPSSEPQLSASQNTDLSASNDVAWWSNPILYWVLAPFAPLLWFVLRLKRRRDRS